MMRTCALCKGRAKLYCEADEAELCWDCDETVHGANFLVARHTRKLLCRFCQEITPWQASGPKLGGTFSVCNRCVDDPIREREVLREEKNEEEPYRCGCSTRKTRGSCGGWLDGENDGDEDDSPGFSAASPPPVTSCSSGCESFAEKSPARRENVGYARFLRSPLFLSCNITWRRSDCFFPSMTDLICFVSDQGYQSQSDSQQSFPAWRRPILSPQSTQVYEDVDEDDEEAEQYEAEPEEEEYEDEEEAEQFEAEPEEEEYEDEEEAEQYEAEPEVEEHEEEPEEGKVDYSSEVSLESCNVRKRPSPSPAAGASRRRRRLTSGSSSPCFPDL